MMESILNTLNNVKSADYHFHMMCSCQLLNGLPFCTLKIHAESHPGDRNLGVVCFPSSREAASKYS